jgi:Raf kinase inhibitor-like YbhB/YbcL family protein
MDDPDAPGGTFAHWALFDLRPGSRGIPAGTVPRGARQGTASTGRASYAPPCPPKGDRPHHYELTLYALSAPLRLPQGATVDEVRLAVARVATGSGRLVATFERR